MKFEITVEMAKQIVELAIQSEADWDSYEGTLLDSYILHDVENIEVHGMSAKYLIIKSRYLNCWSSDYELIMTNDVNKVEFYANIFKQN